MNNNSKTFIWITTALLVILITPQLYIDYEYSVPTTAIDVSMAKDDGLTIKEYADIIRSRKPDLSNVQDDYLAREYLGYYPEQKELMSKSSLIDLYSINEGVKAYEKVGSKASAGFLRRFEFQLKTQFKKLYGGQLFPWNSNREKLKVDNINEYIWDATVSFGVQAYLTWKKDQKPTHNFATFFRTLSESLPSIILIGFPLFILSMFNFFFTSKNSMNEIIKKYGFDKKGFSKFNFEVKGIVGSFFKFFICWYLISKSILVAGIEIIGVSRKQKKSLKPQEVELKTNAKALILTFMQAEGIILLATFLYFYFYFFLLYGIF